MELQNTVDVVQSSGLELDSGALSFLVLSKLMHDRLIGVER